MLNSLLKSISIATRSTFFNSSHFYGPSFIRSRIRRFRVSYTFRWFALSSWIMQPNFVTHYRFLSTTQTPVSSLAEKVKLLQKRGEWKDAWAVITEEQLKQPDNNDDDELWQLKAEILETLQWSDELRHMINNDLKYFGERKPQPYIFKTRSLMSCEKYREAVVVLEEALLSHPNNSDLLLSLVECYLRLNIRISEVRRILTQLRAHNPSDSSLLQKQIEMLLKLQQSSSSRNEINNLLFSLCNEHLQQSPNASLYTLRGKLYLSQNQIAEALNDFKKAIKLIPPNQSHEVHYWLAKVIAKEDPIYALDLLQTYCFSSSGDVMMNIEPEACLLGGDIAFDLGHYKLATNFYVTAYQKCAYQAAKYGLVRCYIMQGAILYAEPLIEELLRSDLNNPYYMLLHSFLLSKDPSTTLNVLNNLLRIYPKCHQALVERAVVLFSHKHDIIQAIKDVDFASHLVNDPEAHTISIYRKIYSPKLKPEVQDEIRQLHQFLQHALLENRPNDALSYCDKILSLDRRNTAAWQQRYKIYTLLYKQNSSQNEIEQMIQSDILEYDEIEYAHFFGARFFTQDSEARRFHLKRALILNPYDPTIVEGAVRNYMEQREYTSAIAHLLRALGGNHPQPAQLLALLALCLLQSGTSNIKNLVDLCLMLVERSLALHPTEEGYLVKATILVQKEQFSEALKSYDNILSFNPHSSFALVGKARIHNMNAQHEEALKYAQMAIPFSEGETKQQALFLKMMSLRELQRFEEAFQAAKELLTLNPDDIAALTIMTSYFVSKGDYESALKPLNKIKNPSISILELKLGVYIAMRDSNQILLCSNEILQKDSKHKRALAMKKMALIELNRWDEVESVCEKILENEPNDISTLLALARACEMNKKSDKALKMITKALTLAPNEAKVWAQGGTLFMMQKEYEKALAYFERAITLDGNNFQFVICKGQALFHLGKHEESYQCFLQAVKMAPNVAEPWFEMAIFYHRLGLLKKAVECYEKCLSIQPKHERARKNCAQIKTVLQHYQQFRSSKPSPET